MKSVPMYDFLVSQQNIQNGDIVLYCGGYKGEYAEEVLKLHDVQVIILEPQIEFYEYCKKKFENDERVLVFNYGLGRKTEEVEFYLGQRKDSSSIYEGRSYKSTESTRTFIRNAQEFYEEFPFTVAKFNAEGAEYDILDVLNIEPIREILLQFHNIKDYSRNNYREKMRITHTGVYLKRHWEIWRK